MQGQVNSTLTMHHGEAMAEHTCCSLLLRASVKTSPAGVETPHQGFHISSPVYAFQGSLCADMGTATLAAGQGSTGFLKSVAGSCSRSFCAGMGTATSAAGKGTSRHLFMTHSEGSCLRSFCAGMETAILAAGKGTSRSWPAGLPSSGLHGAQAASPRKGASPRCRETQILPKPC